MIKVRFVVFLFRFLFFHSNEHLNFTHILRVFKAIITNYIQYTNIFLYTLIIRDIFY